MAEFKYMAKDMRGRTRRGKVKASSKAIAREVLMRQRLRPIAIRATKLDDVDGAPTGWRRFIFKDDKGRWQLQLGTSNPSTKDLIVFTKQFATMINSGVPLMQALGVLAGQQQIRGFGIMLDKVRVAVENGAALSEALEAFPATFDNLYIAMVRAGEASGNLDAILVKLTTYIEKAAKIKSQVKSAMFYPAMVVVVAIAVITALLVFVVPTFAKQFTDAGKELPGLTQAVVDLSTALQENWHIWFGILGAVMFAFRAYVKTENGRAWFDAFLLKTPGFGQLFRKLSVGRFCSTMATMLTSGVPLLEALTICAASAGNKTIEAFILKVRARIEQGSKFSEPLAEGDLIPKMVVSMVAIGETSGALDAMLEKVSEFYEEEVDLAVKTMLSMIEPAMIVIIGSIVGIIVIAMYLPVFDLGNLAGA